MSLFAPIVSAVRARAVQPLRRGITAPGLSEDFRSFCQQNGYAEEIWAKASMPGFGGRERADERLTRDPVILLHGTGGNARTSGKQLAYFLERGYRPSEIYAFSVVPYGKRGWGFLHDLSPRNIRSTQRAIEAVTRYTGRKPVVIAHSQGGLWARAAAAGGKFMDSQGRFHVIPAAPVKRLVNVAVPFWGVHSIEKYRRARMPWVPMCGSKLGIGRRSEQLRYVLDARPQAEDSYSLSSEHDNLLGPGERSAMTATPPGEMSLRLAGLNHAQLQSHPRALAMQFDMAQGEVRLQPGRLAGRFVDEIPSAHTRSGELAAQLRGRPYAPPGGPTQVEYRYFYPDDGAPSDAGLRLRRHKLSRAQRNQDYFVEAIPQV